MVLEICNPYVLRILIAARKEDSIRAISQRIGLSYGWTYYWSHELMKKGVFKAEAMKVFLQKNSFFYKKIMAMVKTMFREDVQFYYEAIQLFGISYCFTGIDAVFVWTNGGYNISRYKQYYPVHVKIEKKDKKIFEEYCRKCRLSVNKKQGVFYAVTYVESINPVIHNTIPVDSMQETVEFMEKHRYNFEPALEMVKEMYAQEIPVVYKEAVTNV